MQKQIENFCIEMEVLKDTLALYAKDRSLPLEDRWDTWKNSPICLKKQRSFSYDMFLGDEELTDDLYGKGYERHQTIDTLEFLERVLENKYCNLFENTPEEDCPPPETWEPEGMDMLKEKILADNVGSFIYDW